MSAGQNQRQPAPAGPANEPLESPVQAVHTGAGAAGPPSAKRALMKPKQQRLLEILGESQGYVACDGPDRKIAHELDRLGFAEWKGTSWGSSFWAITDLGREQLSALQPNNITPP